MNKISKAFKNDTALIGFVTAGDPDLVTSEKIMVKMAQAGCDLLEISIPFSDPVAAGAVLQESNLRALNAGATTDKVFELAKSVSEKTNAPIAFTTYINVLFKYGYDRFLEKTVDSGVSAVVVYDLPYEEKAELEEVAEKYGVEVISVVSPSGKDRLEMICSDAKGFIYTDSPLSASTTPEEAEATLKEVVEAVKSLADIPVAVESYAKNIENHARFADGVIIGIDIVKIIESCGENSPEAVFDFVKEIKNKIG